MSAPVSEECQKRFRTECSPAAEYAEKDNAALSEDGRLYVCGIAGYSLGNGSRVNRVLAAQALLAGIAERGADAAGYSFRADGEIVVRKQQTGASALLDSIALPEATGEGE